MKASINPDGAIPLPAGITTVEIEIPELELTPKQKAHELAIWNASKAVEDSIGEKALRSSISKLYRLIKARDQQVTLALEDARLCRVFDILRGNR